MREIYLQIASYMAYVNVSLLFVLVCCWMRYYDINEISCQIKPKTGNIFFQDSNYNIIDI